MSPSRRSPRYRLLFVAAAVSLIAACGAVPDAAEDPETVPAQALNTVVDGYAVDLIEKNFRTPVAAVVDLGPIHYSVAHVNTLDELVYSHYSTHVGPQVGVFATQQKASWIRANTSPAFSRTCGGHTPEYVNFFAVQADGAVRLERVSVCGQSWNAVDSRRIDDGYNPSFATRGTLNAGRGLLVYGLGNRLLGRFIGFSEFGTSVGAAFEIATVPGDGYFYSTDVIYNKHANRFIVGFIERSALQFCRVKNITVTEGSPTTVGSARNFGVCDSDVGGHATSVAYSPAGDGRYVWWRQDETARKGVNQHGTAGERLGAPVHRTDMDSVFQRPTTWTVPVAATQNPEYPYMFMQGNIVWALKDHLARPVATDTGPNDTALALRSVGGMTVALKIRDVDQFNGRLILSLWGP